MSEPANPYLEIENGPLGYLFKTLGRKIDRIAKSFLEHSEKSDIFNVFAEELLFFGDVSGFNFKPFDPGAAFAFISTDAWKRGDSLLKTLAGSRICSDLIRVVIDHETINSDVFDIGLDLLVKDLNILALVPGNEGMINGLELVLPNPSLGLAQVQVRYLMRLLNGNAPSDGREQLNNRNYLKPEQIASLRQAFIDKGYLIANEDMTYRVALRAMQDPEVQPVIVAGILANHMEALDSRGLPVNSESLFYLYNPDVASRDTPKEYENVLEFGGGHVPANLPEGWSYQRFPTTGRPSDPVFAKTLYARDLVRELNLFRQSPLSNCPDPSHSSAPVPSTFQFLFSGPQEIQIASQQLQGALLDTAATVIAGATLIRAINNPENNSVFFNSLSFPFASLGNGLLNLPNYATVLEIIKGQILSSQPPPPPPNSSPVWAPTTVDSRGRMQYTRVDITEGVVGGIPISHSLSGDASPPNT